MNNSIEDILQRTPLLGLPSLGFMVQPVSVNPVKMDAASACSNKATTESLS